MSNSSKKKIAIIGTGISGLGAASILHDHHEITLYEKNDYIGGHSRTIEVKTKEGIFPVDTGFIVFNKYNYPLLTRLFEHLKVPIIESDMSFGASINNGWLEYGTQRLLNLFAQKRNLLRPGFWGMLADILKFNQVARAYLNKDPSFTLGQCLDELGMRTWFRQYFLLAMGGAIWSMSLAEMLKFPASTLIRFFENHGLLSINDHPQWYTVKGGSREYIQRLTEPFKDRIYLDRGVKKVWRDDSGAIVEDNQGHQAAYDFVVFACHADQVLEIVADPSPEEKKILSAFHYQANRAVVHSDISFMPKRKQAWASWVYLSETKNDKNPCVSLSYWMNALQNLQTDQPLIVTLNPGREPNQKLIYDDYTFEHPVFNALAIRHQSQIDSLQGQNHLWFCGAYQRYGFHEDGLESAVKIVRSMGVNPSW